MGCLCSKAAPIDQIVESQQGKGALDLSKSLVCPSKREQLIGEKVKSYENLVPPTTVSLSKGEKKWAAEAGKKSISHQRRATVDIAARGGGASVGGDPSFRLGGAVPNGMEGEHVAAGWPSWLTAVAGEAVSGWLPRKADSFEKFEKVCIILLVFLLSS